MKKSVLVAALLAGVMCVAGCGGGADALPATTSPPETTSPAAESSTPDVTTAPSSTPDTGAGWEGNVTLTDNQGYQWQATWSFSGPAPVKDISMDPPGQASAVWDTTSATINVVFTTPGRSEPPWGTGVQQGLSLAPLYPANGAVCTHEKPVESMQGGGELPVTLKGPVPGQYCMTMLNSGYANLQRGLVVRSVPEAEVDAVVSELGKPSYLILLGAGDLKSSEADACTIHDPNSYASSVVYSSSSGPVTC